jgi:hypothetical protein
MLPNPIDRDSLREVLRGLMDQTSEQPEYGFFAYCSSMDWPVIPPRGPSSLVRNWERMNDG